MIGSVLESLSEAMTLMKKSDIDPALFLTIVNDSLFRSPLYENYGRIMAEKRYDKAGFTMDLGLKDINLVMEAGKSLNVPLPFAGVIRDALLGGLAHGRQPLDWSALILSSFDRAGIESD
jgi:3-hydroxyisobutyrate dehydrogenase-like beta-hydroxyacid dehydrogenase